MSTRIGELLLGRGMLTDEQLQRALDAQLVYGGHLGTCLIEQGFVNEFDLGIALSEIYGVGYASLEMLADVPGPVIECVPRKLVEKHALVPFELEGRVLHLAMIDPRDILALDEVAHASGLKVRSWISPEIRVLQAMERYYRIPRRLRFVALCRELDREHPFEGPPRPGAATAAPPRDPAPPADGGWYLGVEAAAESPVQLGLEDLGREFGYGRSWRDIVDEGATGPAPAGPEAAAPNAPAPAAAPAPVGPSVAQPVLVASALGLDEAGERMGRADDREQLGRLLLDHAVQGTPRCVLWSVEGVVARVWAQRGFPALERSAAGLRVTVTEEPVFRLVAGSGCYRGPAPAGAEGRRYFGLLGVPAPAEILLFPLHLDDRLVALFYGDCGTWPCIPARTDDYRRLMHKLAYALAIVELKRSLRAV